MQSKNSRLEHLIVICTHHKTGTTWLKRIFEAIAHQQQLNFYLGQQSDLPLDADIFFQEHSMVNLDDLTKYKGLHLIRDPRDIVVSGCFYHLTSNEVWLHTPKKYYGGVTYHQKINSYERFEDQLLFEMDHCARWTINKMTAWNYQQPNVYEAKYEHLVVDRDLFMFHYLFHFLGFRQNRLLNCLQVAYKNSLFSEQVATQKHIRSGKTQQWKSFFNSKHKRQFKTNFGNVLIDLGYEPDNNW